MRAFHSDIKGPVSHLERDFSSQSIKPILTDNEKIDQI